MVWTAAGSGYRGRISFATTAFGQHATDLPLPDNREAGPFL